MAEQADATQTLPRWLEDIRPGTAGEGFVEKHLRHSLIFVGRPVKRLFVSFDNLSNVNNSSLDREPWGFKFAQDNNISHLGIMAHVSDWYRDPVLIDRMQKLAAGGFFDGYDRIVFAGVSMGGFAAIVFASLVPGVHVVSVNPQSTLDPELVPWETRYENGQRQDWTLPLSDAATLTGNLGRVNIFYDPRHALDHQHVSRFEGDNIRVFRARYSQHKTAVFLRKIDALKPIMHHAIFDELTELEFYRLYRARRNLPWFRGSVDAYFRTQERVAIADHFTTKFRQHKRALEKEPEAPKPVEQSKSIEIVGPRGPYQPLSGRSERRLIVTTMKNEGPFMLEWIAFNRMIGFTDFLIYTNDCDDGTDKIAQRLQELGIAQHRENVFKKGGSPQRVALRKSQNEDVFKQADWAICADCDEFLNIRVGDGTLDDLFAKVGDVDAISICWKLFGNSGRIEYDPDLVVAQFDACCAEDKYPHFRAAGMKTLVRQNDRLQRLRIHRPAFVETHGDIAWVDGGGQPMPSAYLNQGWKAYSGFRHDHARLHHYAVRSVESFLVKRDRGRTNHVKDDQGLDYWSTMNHNSNRDHSLQNKTPALRSAMANLLSDPVLADLNRVACDWHRAKIENVLARDGWVDFRDQIAAINRLETADVE